MEKTLKPLTNVYYRVYYIQDDNIAVRNTYFFKNECSFCLLYIMFSIESKHFRLGLSYLNY